LSVKQPRYSRFDSTATVGVGAGVAEDHTLIAKLPPQTSCGSPPHGEVHEVAVGILALTVKPHQHSLPFSTPNTLKSLLEQNSKHANGAIVGVDKKSLGSTRGLTMSVKHP
jgi:hypothetical protein